MAESVEWDPTIDSSTEKSTFWRETWEVKFTGTVSGWRDRSLKDEAAVTIGRLFNVMKGRLREAVSKDRSQFKHLKIFLALQGREKQEQSTVNYG